MNRQVIGLTRQPVNHSVKGEAEATQSRYDREENEWGLDPRSSFVDVVNELVLRLASESHEPHSRHVEAGHSGGCKNQYSRTK